MTVAPEPPPPAGPDPTVAELEALRKEKADRLKAEQDAKEAELIELRGYRKQQEELAARAPKAPVKKAEKAPVVEQTVTPPAKRKGRGGASRVWFGEDDE